MQTPISYIASQFSKVKNIDFLRKSFWNLQSTFVPSLIALIPSIVIRNFLQPGIYGHVATIDTIASYLTFPGTVLRSGMDRGVPELRGQGNPAKAKNLQESVLSASLILSLVVGCVIFIYASTIEDYKLRIGSMLWALVIATQIINRYFKIYFKTEQMFYILGKIDLLYSFFLAVTNVCFVWLWGFPGLYLGTFCVGLLQIVHYFWNIKVRLNIGFSVTDLKYSIKSGLPFLSVSLLSLNIRGMDRVFVIKQFSSYEMGIYSIVTLVFTNFIMINSAVLGVFFQSHFSEISKQSATDHVEKLFARTMVLCLLGGLICGCVYFFLPVFLMVMPKFREALIPARMILIGCYFFTGSGMYEIFLISQKKTGAVLLSYLGSTLCALLGLFYVSKYWLSLFSVVIVMDTAFCLLLIMMLASSFIHVKLRLGKAIKVLIRIIIPLCISVLSILFSEYIVFSIGVNSNGLLSALCGGCIFLFMYGSICLKIRNKLLNNMSLVHL